MLFLLFTFALLNSWVVGYYDIDDSILYKVDFPGIKKEDTDAENKGLFAEDSETYTIVDRNKEKYECSIPKVVSGDTGKDLDYTGLSPLQIMGKVFSELSCAYRKESYWTYELCHGRYLRQFREERVGKEIKVTEYFLGKFSMEKFQELTKEEDKDKENDITRQPPIKRIEAMTMPYFELQMEDGTICDLNGQPRRARILYICYLLGRNEIYQLKETSTCEYEVIVLSSSLCTHPQFVPKDSNEHGISCRPVNPESSAKPVDLMRLEAESSKYKSSRMWEAHLKDGDTPGQVKIELRPVVPGTVSKVDLEEQEDKSIAKDANWKVTKREPFKPLMDPQVVKEFLRGEYCLYGGSGWWRYEFCYGKKVEQYHTLENGQKTVILLGKFNTEQHLLWIKEHPTKKPKPVELRKHVSHFYSEGDICDLTGNPRQIEVKMKCKKAESPSAVTLYMQEPKPCQYLLVVESPLVCDILVEADSDTGIIPPQIIASLDNPAPLPLKKVARDPEQLEMFGIRKETITMEEFKRRLLGQDTESQTTTPSSIKQKSTFSSKSFTVKETSSSSKLSTVEDTVNGEVKYSSSTVEELLENDEDGSQSLNVLKVSVTDGVKTTVTEKVVDGVLVESQVVQQTGATDQIEEETGTTDQIEEGTGATDQLEEEVAGATKSSEKGTNDEL